MADETEIGPAGAPDSGRHPQGSGGVGSPLQARAAFVKNWDWQSLISINRGACQRGSAQHGINSETGSTCAQEWEALRPQILTLGHRSLPFRHSSFGFGPRPLARTLLTRTPDENRPCTPGGWRIVAARRRHWDL